MHNANGGCLFASCSGPACGNGNLAEVLTEAGPQTPGEGAPSPQPAPELDVSYGPDGLVCQRKRWRVCAVGVVMAGKGKSRCRGGAKR